MVLTSDPPVLVQIPVNTDVHEQKSNEGNETMNNDVEIHVVDLERILLTEIHRDSFAFSCLAVVDVTSELRGHHMGLRCVEAAVVHARHLLCARHGARRELEEARNIV